jgi:hypothetical protein
MFLQNEQVEIAEPSSCSFKLNFKPASGRVSRQREIDHLQRMREHVNVTAH